MKYVAAFLSGLVVGVAAFMALLYFNPLTNNNRLSVLSVSDNLVLTFNYSAVATDVLVYTNDGRSQVSPHPGKVLQLWEPTVRRTEAFVTVLRDGRNQPAAIGVKFLSDSESTNVLNGEAMVDSTWHVYAPGQGSFFVEQQENYWNFLRDIVIPARWGSSDGWRGNWNASITSGPGALGTSRVVGGSGIFAGLETDAVESFSATAYSANHGPLAMDAELAVEMPRRDAAVSQDP